MGRDRNHNNMTAEHSNIHMGRAVAPESSSLVYSVDNIPQRGQYCYSQRELDTRVVEQFSSGSRVGDLYSYASPHPGLSYNCFPNIPAGGRLYNVPDNDPRHVPSSCYNRHTIHEVQDDSFHHTVNSERGPFKRKSSTFSAEGERGSGRRFFGAGSSSNSYGHESGKPPVYYQCHPTSSSSLPRYRGGSLSIGTDHAAAARNVRSRSRINLESNSNRNFSSYSSHHYCPIPHQLNHSGPMDINYLNSDATAYNHNHIAAAPPAPGRFQTTVNTGLRHEMNRHFVGGSSVGTDGFNHDSISSRNHIPVSPHPFGSHSQALRADHSHCSWRPIPSYMSESGSSHFRQEAGRPERGLQLLSETYASRFSRPFSTGGWHNDLRDISSRMDTERFQSQPNALNPLDRMNSETLMMDDRLSLYESRNFFDQYRDMRLDINNMSYEELLALGERIGNVSTGLSKDVISACLRKERCISDGNQEGATCTICLENYKKDEEIGTLKNCSHEYHVECVERWLLTKNTCPICKAAAFTDCSED
ncbi:probable E3 ubiquitin-protein ligase ZFP1 [Carica papaya]|uniref:probable E3 ubiquitin-protein ligase ZFP1 n=1 Tax=Carica papaya TaxID=3649 RepID=UPI000B8C6E01|nr:probable E3 ubiquitin-protein ligase ZFP1 [Carica papaya]XP_021897716.1 probable E3 ubiquitin-protein ligase ZFP1 [Carica papaya]XP_021897717.1 probable E3 ubiquitin-protein ligase ZFP1 [Carica papaya]XP_021897718.1 probable E3 ubiquitin-protein ligase ZFP1 [Carica papaya]XP_021897719.1 probable E3 ubiquitin-protein ligase ZFP1 [Carica papaya]XP_021897720.1 probable E3 ubiquitin-protein ligase ZFP1 [Carica papaya]